MRRFCIAKSIDKRYKYVQGDALELSPSGKVIPIRKKLKSSKPRGIYTSTPLLPQGIIVT